MPFIGSTAAAAEPALFKIDKLIVVILEVYEAVRCRATLVVTITIISMMAFAFHAAESDLTIPLSHVTAAASELLEARQDRIQKILQCLAELGLGQPSGCHLQVIDGLDEHFPKADRYHLWLVLFSLRRSHLVLVLLALVALKYRIRLPTIEEAHCHGAHEHGLTDGEEEHFGGALQVQPLIVLLHHKIAND